MTTAYQPGNILLVRDYSGSSDLIGNLILAGNRARHGNSDVSRWTHSALIVSDDGKLVEADAAGVTLAHASEYADRETLIINPPVSRVARSYAVRFALAHVGDAYDVLDFLSLAGTLLTGLDLSLHSDRHFICSQLVSRATECFTDHGYPWPSEQMLPSDLAAFWDADSRDPLPPLSLIGRLLDKLAAVAHALSPFTHGLRP